MTVAFEKFHGSGNDFILIDNRNKSFHPDEALIKKLCNRRIGIGADGLILLENHPDFDFEMIYFNADGALGSMCGNGGRCAVIYAKELKMITDGANFLAYDGVHTATIIDEEHVKLSMNSVKHVSQADGAYILDTGSPHYVSFVDSVATTDVMSEGKKVRFSDEFKEKGINVNFAEVENGDLRIRTYERGVEDETLSCGTGTVACAIAASLKLEKNDIEQSWQLHSIGGELKVHFRRDSADHFSEIYLEGPVVHVFHGTIVLPE